MSNNNDQDNNNQGPQDNAINVELPADIAEGIYSNLAIITHSNSEFVVDFVRMLPGVPQAKVKARIILTPQHAKRLAHAIAENVHRFEAIHGQIEDFGDAQPAFPMVFGGPTGQA